MHRTRRRRWMIAAAVWLLLAVGVAAGWKLSFDHGARYAPPGGSFVLFIRWGFFELLVDGQDPWSDTGWDAWQLDPGMSPLARFLSNDSEIDFRSASDREALGLGLPRIRTGLFDGWTAIMIPFWLPLAAVLTACGFCVWRGLRRPRPGRCEACGYDLTGNTSGTCPECGQAVAA